MGDETVMDEYAYFDDLALVPSVPEPLEPADVSHDFNVVFNTYADGKNYASFNNVRFASVTALLPRGSC